MWSGSYFKKSINHTKKGAFLATHRICPFSGPFSDNFESSTNTKTFKMTHGIIIPCYNEADRLNLPAFQKFAKDNKDYHVLFVNDGSKDDTAKVLTKFSLAQNHFRLRVLDLKQNVGKAEAVRQGVQHLLSNTEVDTIGFIDADLSTDFNDYQALVKRLKRDSLKMVFGSRNQEGENGIERSAFRKFLSMVVGFFIKMILRLPISDTQCGAKVFNRKTAKQVFGSPFLSRWLFDVEIFIKLRNEYGVEETMTHIKEQTLMRWVHEEGSKITMKDSIKIPAMLLKIGYHYDVTPSVQKTLNMVGLSVRPAA